MPYPGDDDVAIVIDNGSGVCKAGFSGDDEPRSIFPNVIGRPKEKLAIAIHESEGTQKDSFIGSDAQRKRGVLSLSYPVERGIVTNWDDMETVWHHIYDNELCVKSENCPVFLSETVNNPSSKREKMTEIMFEQFKAPSLFVSVDAILSMYASGHTTGVVFSSGEGVSSAVPIYEGYGLAPSVARKDLAGLDVTNFLQRLLGDRGYDCDVLTSQENVREVKEDTCYAAADYDAELTAAASDENRTIDRTYELPNGQMIHVAEERFKCVEGLFHPSLMGIESCGIHKLIFHSVMKASVDLRKDLFRNIVLSGGTTTIPGIGARLKKELLQLVHTATEVGIIENEDRENYAWIGGSILSSLRNYCAMWLTKEQYEEEGSRIIHRIGFKF